MAVIDHTQTDPEMVFTDEEELEMNDDLMAAVDATDVSTKEYDTFESSTSGYSECLN